MRRFHYLLACATLFISALGSAQPAPNQTRRVQLSRVILNPIPAASQHVKGGTICLFSGDALDFGTTEHTLNLERFERIFAAAMREHHFNVVTQSSSLFDGEGSSANAEYLIGGTVHPQSVDICESVNGQKGSFTIAVRSRWSNG